MFALSGRSQRGSKGGGPDFAKPRPDLTGLSGPLQRAWKSPSPDLAKLGRFCIKSSCRNESRKARPRFGKIWLFLHQAVLYRETRRARCQILQNAVFSFFCIRRSFGPRRARLGWAGGWAGLGWAGLGWAGLGWAGLGWAGWAGLGGAGRGGAGLGWVGWAGLGWAGLGGLGWAGLGWAGLRSVLGWAGLGGARWAGLGWAGLGWAGPGQAGGGPGRAGAGLQLPASALAQNRSTKISN